MEHWTFGTSHNILEQKELELSQKSVYKGQLTNPKFDLFQLTIDCHF